jgi:hypothetical protein
MENRSEKLYSTEEVLKLFELDSKKDDDILQSGDSLHSCNNSSDNIDSDSQSSSEAEMTILEPETNQSDTLEHTQNEDMDIQAECTPDTPTPLVANTQPATQDGDEQVLNHLSTGGMIWESS